MDLPNVTALLTSASSFQNKFPWKTPKNLRSEYQSESFGNILHLSIYIDKELSFSYMKT